MNSFSIIENVYHVQKRTRLTQRIELVHLFAAVYLQKLKIITRGYSFLQPALVTHHTKVVFYTTKPNVNF